MSASRPALHAAEPRNAGPTPDIVEFVEPRSCARRVPLLQLGTHRDESSSGDASAADGSDDGEGVTPQHSPLSASGQRAAMALSTFARALLRHPYCGTLKCVASILCCTGACMGK